MAEYSNVEHSHHYGHVTDITIGTTAQISLIFSFLTFSWDLLALTALRTPIIITTVIATTIWFATDDDDGGQSDRIKTSAKIILWHRNERRKEQRYRS